MLATFITETVPITAKKILCKLQIYEGSVRTEGMTDIQFGRACVGPTGQQMGGELCRYTVVVTGHHSALESLSALTLMVEAASLRH